MPWRNASDPAVQALGAARATIAATPMFDVHVAAARLRMLALCDTRGEALLRTCYRPGHLTASAFVIDAAGERVLLHHHRKLDRWLQLGGHCDGDGDLVAVALREATEESGIVGLELISDADVAWDLDIHEVAPPAEPPHLHHDARFVFRAPAGAEPVRSDESHDIRWFTWDEAAVRVDEDRLRELFERAADEFGP